MEAAGKIIKYWDGMFDASYRNHAYSFMSKSMFKIGWQDSFAIETSNNQYLHSEYSNEDMDRLGMLQKLDNSEAQSMLEGYLLTRSVVNLSVPSDVHWNHTHRGQRILLYYANISWNHEWAGETVFYDEDCYEITKAISYKPGRLVLFDGDIPHAIRPQSSAAPHYRFTLSMIFDKSL